MDLFKNQHLQPNHLKAILSRYSTLDYYDHRTRREILLELEKIGYTFDYGIDSDPKNLRKMNFEVVNLENGKKDYFMNADEVKEFVLEKIDLGNNTIDDFEIISENKDFKLSSFKRRPDFIKKKYNYKFQDNEHTT